MATISLRLNDNETRLLNSYAKSKNINVSKFIRDTIFERIDDDLNIDEERILAAWKASKKESAHPASEVWDDLGI